MSNTDDNSERLSSDENINLFIATIKKLKQSFEIDIPNQCRILYDELAKAGWYILPQGWVLYSLAQLLKLNRIPEHECLQSDPMESVAP